MHENSHTDYSKEQIPILEDEVRQLKSKLHLDYPDATSAQLETAIGNALKTCGDPFDLEQVESVTRHHLGYIP